jgi:hypothetical protein
MSNDEIKKNKSKKFVKVKQTTIKKTKKDIWHKNKIKLNVERWNYIYNQLRKWLETKQTTIKIIRIKFDRKKTEDEIVQNIKF